MEYFVKGIKQVNVCKFWNISRLILFTSFLNISFLLILIDIEFNENYEIVDISKEKFLVICKLDFFSRTYSVFDEHNRDENFVRTESQTCLEDSLINKLSDK